LTPERLGWNQKIRTGGRGKVDKEEGNGGGERGTRYAWGLHLEGKFAEIGGVGGKREKRWF